MRVLLRWAGDDPDREGLLDTPKRVAKAYREMFGGYDMCPAEELGRTFEEVAGYDDLVHRQATSPSIRIASTTWCRSSARRMSATCRTARCVGLSKIARVVDIFAHRLQTQEAMTAQIAGVIQDVLNPRGVAVMIEAEHMCMAMRGIRKQGSTTLTSTFTGTFKDDAGRAAPLPDHGAQWLGPLSRRRRQTRNRFDVDPICPRPRGDKADWKKARSSRRASMPTAWSPPS